MERIKNPPHRVTVRIERDSTCTVLSIGPSTQRELKNGSYYHLSLMNVYKMLQKNAVTTRCCYSHPKTVQYFNKVKHFPHTLYLSIFTFCFVFQSRMHFHHIFLGSICSTELYSPWTSSSPKHGLQTENGRSLEGKETVLAHLSFCLVRAAILLLAK